ncbi:hypothetical protein GPECTOR_50g635 [Gonium pectorale]|uniref:Uncharacterized protein n=1 Tax=Gonium pectorale TaxID=33097 RepID=A0A150G7P3_GONPE|nr:hypothetical protein GPECTOR_50g635 [Gonium pectorale]|eukprot:KXZ45841.1 hypothetical protein GPECTOR_50g635 [Gonium pectorale]
MITDSSGEELRDSEVSLAGPRSKTALFTADVCMAEMERNDSVHAQHFIAGAFSKLRKDFGVDGLLLTQITGPPSADGGINDICWDDIEPTEKRLNTVAYAAPAASYMQIRCQRLTLPTANVLQKLWCRTRTLMSLPSFVGVAVHLMPSDGSCGGSSFVLDQHGGAIPHALPVAFSVDRQSQPGIQSGMSTPPPWLDIHVDGPNGVIATGRVPYSELYRAAMQQRDAVDEDRAASEAGTCIEVQVRGAGEYLNKAATVTIMVTRVRKETSSYGLAQVAPDSMNVEAVNKNTLRTNACLAYDTALSAALDGNGCGRNKLLVEGPWEWLLSRFASSFGVRPHYCVLAHLRWVLKPGIATISTMCLDVISQGLQPLLQQQHSEQAGALTIHEATLLESVKKAVEMLLEVAFENYYALSDDQSREGAETPTAHGAPASAWRPTILMASFRLFNIMRKAFLPTDHEWLNARFRVAAKKRWHFLECNCGFDQIRDLPHAPPVQTRPMGTPVGTHKLGVGAYSYDTYYKMAERMSMAIRSDLEYDMFLQASGS